MLMSRRDRADDRRMTRSRDTALRRVALATGLVLATLTVLWLVSALATASLIPGHWGDVARIALASLVSGTASAVLIPRDSGEMRSA
jgi:low temperature requirement protein LtrA